ncbi:AAA family ATPase [Paludicola sp. MB14-C6]|uniref:AAA family ATPase n=1 Tax=Paludihabitans sp. MB14-C6 TaxID=3070656 RepID=UPI0027DCCD0D|nr:AAA family ATPase [Paludicola sp. MB14-C6]WMJ22189.1 AAA family ATPase [Paludicola sp. MB14-C6]
MLNGLYINDVILSKPIERTSYLYDIPSVNYLINNHKISFQKKVTFFVGENGTGKSTFLEAIAVAFGFNAEGGTKNFSFSTNQSHSELWKHITLSKSKIAKDGFFLRAESFYNFASKIDQMDSEPSFGALIIDSYGGVSLHEQSHGESFLALVQNRFGGNGVYILDEPEAALSPMRLLTLLAEINELTKRNSQFIIATHSPILMTYPDAEILEFSQKGIQSVGYKDTEHYQITRRFLENPEQIYKYLFEE